jgi:DNA helicase-2/ATP-dependent DNA helicase PcrA
MDGLVTSGIPFRVRTDGRMWTDRLGDYADAVANFQDGEPLTGLQARRLADMLVDSAFGSNERDELFDAIDELQEETGIEDLTKLEIDPDEIRNFAPFTPEPASASDMVRKVTQVQKKTLTAYFRGEYRDVSPERVRVGTIHSAKGREADHVFVATDLAEKVVEQMSATVDHDVLPDGVEFDRSTSPVPVLTDNERRVFYVGMSRARERLVVMENLISGAPTLPIDVLLCNEPREESVEELLAETLEVPAP